MRSFNRFSLCLLILACLLAACGGAPVTGGLSAAGAPNAAASNTPTSFFASLSEIAGRVLARQAVETQFLAAQNGYRLELLGQIQTESQSLVRLDFPNGTLVRLGQNTLFTLQAPETQSGDLLMRVRLELGRLWVILNGGSLEVETKSGVAAVRGSYLSVSYTPETGLLKITCLEGNCSLTTQAGSVEITAGQTATVTGVDQLPQTGEMDAQDFQDWLANNPEATLLVPTVSPEPSSVPSATALPSATPPSLAASFPVVIYPTATAKPVKPAPPAPTAAPTVVPTVVPPSLVPTVTITSILPIVMPVVVAQPLTLTALVSSATSGSAPTGPAPTGIVKFLAGTYLICSANLSATSSATCSGGIPNVGYYNLVADYVGDANFLGAQSPALTNYQVTTGMTTTAIHSLPDNPVLLNTPVWFTATVDNAYAPLGMPTGNVIFSNGQDQCQVFAAPWECYLTFTSTGPQTVKATYSGDSNFIGSLSSPVNYLVLATADTQFSAVTGPNGITLLTSLDCSQTYSVDLLDVDGVSEVKVLYSDNPAFPIDQLFLLGKSGSNTWGGFNVIPVGVAPNTIYWRLAVLDGVGNWFYYGGGVAYSNKGDNNAYSYVSNVVCP
jgi:hypothetical protein